MKNLKIGTRIALSLLLPLLGLIFFSGSLVLEKRHTATEMERLQNLAQLAPIISNLVHELQIERGIAAVYIGSKGKKYKAELPLQFVKTDAKRELLSGALTSFDGSAFNTTLIEPELDETGAPVKPVDINQSKEPEEEQKTDTLKYNNPILEKILGATEALEKIKKVRTKTQKRRTTGLRMAAFYTKTIAQLLSIVEEMTVRSSDARVTSAITAYTSFLQSKERAGIERDMGGTGFSTGAFRYLVHKKFVELIAQQKAFLETFAVNATVEQKDFLKTTLTGKAIDDVKRMRIIATASIQEEFDLQGITADQWSKAITQKIELLKVVEDKIAEDLIALVSSIQSSAQTAFMTLLITTLALLAVTSVFVYFIVNGITGPVGSMTRAMSTLAKGDLETEVPARGRKDEIGEMSDAVQMFKDNAIRVKQMEIESEQQKHKAEEEKSALMLKLADDFEASVGGVVNSVSSASTEMQSSATALSSTAEETSKQAEAVAVASEEASTNVQTVAAASEELSSSIAEISRQVAQSTQIAGTAVIEVDSTNEKIQGLAEAANKIGEVVSMITDIAEQTNLLALNATIEAARAGDAGKGFAVVASEVKNLASQTARATEEISTQISSVQGATQDAVTAIDSIGGTINQLNEISSAIAAAVEEQGAATQEIARNVEQASHGTTEVSTNISGVQQAAGETGSSAGEMLSAAGELSQQSELLRGEVDKFLGNIRDSEKH